MVDYPQLDAANYSGPVAIFKTNKGDIKIKLFSDIAPKTVENFITHAKNGYYNNGIFHRVISDFMIQGGDPEGTGMGGESIWGGSFEDEFSDRLFNTYGALSMANAGPNTNGSQFFIVQASNFPSQMVSALRDLPAEVADFYRQKGGTPWLDGKHTVFGQVIEGLNIVDEIAKVKVDMADKPRVDVVINTIEIAGA
ncbi:peptidylprolyl isomerase [Leuconostoc mesenteroides subsp. mesenteroides]|uniref:peptidylprolyl isomerase n=1 Tax=Leuconostoc mesenteroides TaxID=1245 RepID=UPI0009FFA594|nr:peptidylprolyl isomerase [Leuconostoc mesenteroides]ARN64138.1 peptidylprolyl isomerase [Leuconostoc mesenteroides subsp. mesenteroides]MDV8928542.1 peptidylprolyl isomerase [Leuconostoc mesenteroides]ORI88572.1 peptidylprolyl isomerase [Leuconostoc mesenteroides subsp. mesenteroides]ORI91523.1 peptidylprolyl isomerase [Leuconostoc mesenteroides subsp. mesenteroides]